MNLLTRTNLTNWWWMQRNRIFNFLDFDLQHVTDQRCKVPQRNSKEQSDISTDFSKHWQGSVKSQFLRKHGPWSEVQIQLSVIPVLDHLKIHFNICISNTRNYYYLGIFSAKWHQKSIAGHRTVILLISHTIPSNPKSGIDIFRIFTDFGGALSSVHNPRYSTSIFRRSVGFHVMYQGWIHTLIVFWVDTGLSAIFVFWHHSEKNCI